MLCLSGSFARRLRERPMQVEVRQIALKQAISIVILIGVELLQSVRRTMKHP